MRETSTAKVNILDLLLTVARHGRFLALFTILTTLAGVVTSLVITPEYTAATELLPPEDNSNSIMGLVQSVSVSKFLSGNLLSGGSAEYVFLALSRSRQLRVALVDSFDLVHVYKFHKARKWYIEDVLKRLDKFIAVYITEEGTIRILAIDRSPQRAADMARFIGDRMNAHYTELMTQKARNQRLFLEERCQEVEARLADAEDALAAFQRDSLALSIEDQTMATVQAGVPFEAQYLSTQLLLDMYRTIYSEDNPQIRELKKKLGSLDRQKSRLYKSRQSDVLIPLTAAPELAIGFLRLKRDLKVQELLYEFVLQELERTKLEEARQTPRLQIMDPAVPPQKRTSPKRKFIVAIFLAVGGTLGVVIVSVIELVGRLEARDPANHAKLKELTGLLRPGRKKP